MRISVRFPIQNWLHPPAALFKELNPNPGHPRSGVLSANHYPISALSDSWVAIGIMRRDNSLRAGPYCRVAKAGVTPVASANGQEAQEY